MSASVSQPEDPARIVPGLPDAGDLADVWLAHALASLLALADGEDELDGARSAVIFAALALEARLNSVLRCCDPDERHALGHLAPVEKFRLAPRLLAELNAAAEDAALCDLVAEVFAARDALVDANGTHGRTLDAAFARAIVEESARICLFLSSLVHAAPTGTAVQVHAEAAALADRLAAREPVTLPRWDWDWDEFPPNLIGS